MDLARSSRAARSSRSALPALTLHTQLPSFTDLPRSIGIVRTYEAIQKAFPGAQTPASVVVKRTGRDRAACSVGSPRSSARPSRPAR